MSINLEEFAEKHQIKYFLICFTDLLGINRSKLVPKRAIKNMQENGAGFAGFASYLDLTPADSDMFAIPDTNSLVILPWNKEIAWVAADLFINAEPLAHAPRNVLKNTTRLLKAKGYELKTGVECEFIIFDETEAKVSDVKDTSLKPCYDQEALLRRYDLIAKICDYMEEMGWEPYQNDHEDGNGQFEMNWGYADALTTADRHTFFKFMVRTVAEQEGYRATFMPKPNADITGNGCHVHFSLWSADDINVFEDQKGELGLSKLAYSFLGGILENAEALTAITNPSVNSYKRLHASTTLSGATWSPSTISYSGNNRTHMVRIPEPNRFELRLPDGAANPYLMPSAIMALGMNGMENSIPPGTRSDTNNYDSNQDCRGKTLPLTLNESLNYLEKSVALEKYLGSSFIDSYLKIKKNEFLLSLGHISEWEKNFYMDI